jgi:hypothetical protein
MIEIDGKRINVTLGKVQELVRQEKAAGVPITVTFAVMLALVQKVCDDEGEDYEETLETLAAAIINDMTVEEARH